MLRSFRWSLPLSVSQNLVEDLRQIPGVRIRKGIVTATPDLSVTLSRILGAPGLQAVPVLEPEPMALPERLFPWQREGARLLVSGQRRGLWHATGLGKTATALVAANALGVERVLIVTRSMGRDAYPRDAIWAAPGRQVAIVIGEGKETKSAAYAVTRANRRLEDLRARGSNVVAVGKASDCKDAWAVVIPWETLSTQLAHLQTSDFSAWPLVIFDEHHMGKGRTSARTKAAHAIVKSASSVWSLTATPIRDRLRDLWAQLYCVSPQAWGTSSWNFAKRYCNLTPNQWGGYDSTGSSNIDELKERLAYWFDVKTRAEIRHQLPAKTRNIIRLSSDNAERVYEQKGDWSDRRGVEAAIAIAAAAKIDFVTDRAIEALVGREKVILVGNRIAWLPKAVSAIEAGLKTIRNVREKCWIRVASGEVSVSDRQALAREFLAVPGPAILIATIDSISESIDLQDADRMIVAALPYTPGQIVQLEGRVTRPGQSRPVSIDYVVAQATIDEAIEQLLLSKLETVEESGTDTERVGVGFTDGWRASEEDVVAGLCQWLKKSAENAA